MKRIVFFTLIGIFLISCNRNPLKIDVSEVDLKLEINHFEEDLKKFPFDSSFVKTLDIRYGEFFKIFTHRMIWIGGIEEEGFIDNLEKFASDTLIEKLNGLVDKKIDHEKLESDLETAFKHYKFYFPEKEVPEVSTCISGFNQSIVTAGNIIGISLDKFLGTNCQYYPQLGLPEYKRKRMNPYNIVPEVMKAWAITEFPKSEHSSNLLSHMIFQGKIMYFVDAMLPAMHDTLKIGYTAKQLNFCKAGEAGMWTFLAEHKLLFSSQRMDVKRYIDDGPYTNSFTTESPGRTGVWLGWQIVRAYMKKNETVTLSQLMNNHNYQEILSQSGYHPD